MGSDASGLVTQNRVKGERGNLIKIDFESESDRVHGWVKFRV